MKPPRAQFDPTKRGIWENPELGTGYFLDNRNAIEGMLFGIKIVYDFHPDPDRPLYWLQSRGLSIAAGHLEGMDFGSVPVWLQRTLPRDGLLAYFLHDYAYRFGGLFFREPGERDWQFRMVTRAEADALLRVQARRDPVAKVGRIRAGLVWMAVRACAHFRFHTWKPGDTVPRWPVVDKPDVDDPLPMY